jgi:hypothetical protein
MFLSLTKVFFKDQTRNDSFTAIIAFMRKDKDNSKKWLYFMTGNEKIKKFNSCPSKIIKDLQEII